MSRSGRARRRTRGTPQRKHAFWGIVAGLSGIALLAGLGGFYLWAKENQVRLDANNCPVSGPAFIHVVLIDRSDPISPLQTTRIQQMVDELARNARTGERFDLYVAEGDGVNVLAPAVSVCSAGRGEDASQLYQNPDAIERAFQQRFVAPLKSATAMLLEPASRSTSPILESLRTVAVTSFGSAPRAGHRLTVVSDLIQHSSLNSHFRGEMNFNELQRRPQWTQLRANLTGTEVRILYLLRPTARRQGGQPIQTLGHQQFWRDVFEASGASRLSLESL